MPAVVFNRLDSGLKITIDGVLSRIIKETAPDIQYFEGPVKQIKITPQNGLPFILLSTDTITLPDEAAPTALSLPEIAEVLSNDGFFKSGGSDNFMPDFSDGHHSRWYVNSSNTTGSFTSDGTAATMVSNGGAVPTARSVATTNKMTQSTRAAFVTTAVAQNGAGLRNNSAVYFRGDGPGKGRFKFKARFFFSAAAPVANRKFFVGMHSASGVIAAGTVPNTLLNIIGFGCDISVGPNLKVMSNDGAGVATEVDLGADFPGNTDSLDYYEVRLDAPSNANYVRWYIRNISTGKVKRGTITADLPAQTQLLSWQYYLCNGASTLVDAIDINLAHGWKPH